MNRSRNFMNDLHDYLAAQASVQLAELPWYTHGILVVLTRPVCWFNGAWIPRCDVPWVHGPYGLPWCPGPPTARDVEDAFLAAATQGAKAPWADSLFHELGWFDWPRR